MLSVFSLSRSTELCTKDYSDDVLPARTDRDVYAQRILFFLLCLCNSRLQQSAHRVDQLTHSRWLKTLSIRPLA